MARPLRIEYPGALYHVTSRGNAKNKIFSDDQDRERFLETLGDVVNRYNWLCYAYCLMDNHYHLMIETPDANLSIGMRQLNGVYTQQNNRSHGTVGHLFQGRFKAILVQKENYLMELCRYVVLNPVRAKMVEEPAAWRWSSYSATAGISRNPGFLKTDGLLGLFSNKTKMAQKRYRAFVRAGMDQKSLWDKVRGQVLLGEEKFVEKHKGLIDEKGKIREIPRLQRYVGRPSLKKIFRGQESKRKRNQNIFLACMTYGYKLKEIADELKIHYTTVSKAVARHTEDRN